MAKNQVTLTFAGDEKDLSRAFNKLGDDAQRFSKKFGDASDDMKKKGGDTSSFLSRSFATAAGNIMASFSQAVTGAALDFFKGMVDEAREAEKVSRSTAQGIKTMGAASWITAKQVGDLSESISNKIGVDDELIQSSANLILTFGNVRNAVGENNNIFDRAVAAAQDLAAKGFGDADSAAKMLGKALNDPIHGLTALSRAGVTFTDTQKDTIKKMVETGDVLGAQKIIMQELERQVGGTAEATASSADKMSVAWANFQEDLGTAILPILDGLLTKLNQFLEWASHNQEIVIAFAGITAAVWLLNFALNANPIVAVISGIAALVGAFIWLWNTVDGFRNFFVVAWQMISDNFTAAVNWIGDRIEWVKGGFGRLVSFFIGFKDTVAGIFRGIGDAISNAFKTAVNAVVSVLNGAITGINVLIKGYNAIPFAPDIPLIPKIPKMHTGGVVPGMPGEEVLTVLQAGERVSTSSQGGGSGTATVEFKGDTDSAFATAFQKLVRTGVITVSAA